MDKGQVPAVRAEIQLRRHSYALVCRSDTEPIAHIIQIVCSGKKVEKIRVLKSLDASQGRLVRKKRPAFRMLHDQLVEPLGDLLSPAFSKRPQARQTPEILLRQFKELEPPP